MPKSVGTLNIVVNGSIRQTFEVIEGVYTIEDIFDLVSSGDAVTTVGYVS